MQRTRCSSPGTWITVMILSFLTHRSGQTVDPDQTAPLEIRRQRSSLIQFYTACFPSAAFGPIIIIIIISILEPCFPLPRVGLFSSPEPSGLQGELIVYPYSGVRRRRCCCRQQCLNIFSSETALPIKAKFYVEPPWEGGTKVDINGPGHMTKLAAMPIYGKNL